MNCYPLSRESPVSTFEVYLEVAHPTTHSSGKSVKAVGTGKTVDCMHLLFNTDNKQ